MKSSHVAMIYLIPIAVRQQLRTAAWTKMENVAIWLLHMSRMRQVQVLLQGQMAMPSRLVNVSGQQPFIAAKRDVSMRSQCKIALSSNVVPFLAPCWQSAVDYYILTNGFNNSKPLTERGLRAPS